MMAETVRGVIRMSSAGRFGCNQLWEAEGAGGSPHVCKLVAGQYGGRKCERGQSIQFWEAQSQRERQTQSQIKSQSRRQDQSQSQKRMGSHMCQSIQGTGKFISTHQKSPRGK